MLKIEIIYACFLLKLYYVKAKILTFHHIESLAICFITYTETLRHEIKMQGKFLQHAGINWTKWPTYLLRF